MKKLIALVLALALVCGLAACGRVSPTPAQTGETAQPETELPSSQAIDQPEVSDDWYLNNTYPPLPLDPELGGMLDKINAGVPDLPICLNEDITEEEFKSYFFIDPVIGFRAVKSMAGISAIPHVACLMQIPDTEDTAAIAAMIEENADPAKWICASAEKVVVEYKGNLILLVMSFTDVADAIAKNFREKL